MKIESNSDGIKTSTTINFGFVSYKQKGRGRKLCPKKCGKYITVKNIVCADCFIKSLEGMDLGV